MIPSNILNPKGKLYEMNKDEWIDYCENLTYKKFKETLQKAQAQTFLDEKKSEEIKSKNISDRTHNLLEAIQEYHNDDQEFCENVEKDFQRIFELLKIQELQEEIKVLKEMLK